MKNLLTIAFAMLLSVFSYAQNWAPIGASWNYDFEPQAKTGRLEVKAIGDTTIDSKTVRVLSVKAYTFNYTNNQFEDFTWDNIYTFEDNGVIYNYINNKFYKLYDFNAAESDVWDITGGEPMSSSCDSISEVKVASVSTESINGNNLKSVVLHQKNQQSWLLQGKVLERIGTTETFMFPQVGCVTDAANIGKLRCYKDDVIGEYKFSESTVCDLIVGIISCHLPNYKTYTYPNPANQNINIVLKDNFEAGYYTITVTDLLGKVQVIKNENLGFDVNNFMSKTYFSIDVSNLKTGIYNLQLSNNQTIVYSERFVKQ